MNPIPSRRSFLTAITAAGTLAVTGCSSSSKKTSSSPTNTSTATSNPAAVAVAPVAGFSTTPTWTQPAHVGTPMTDVGAAWSQGHAWFCSQVTDNTFVINAYDPTTKQLVTSPAQTGDIHGAQLFPVVSPSAGLVIYGKDPSWCVTLNGSTMTITQFTIPSGTTNKPQWMGDALFIQPWINDTDADPTNAAPAQPAQVLDTAKGAWVKLAPKNAGMSVAGLTFINGTHQNVEVTPNHWTQQTQIKVGSHSGTALGSVVFALGGKIITANQKGDTFTPLDETVKVNAAGVWHEPSSISSPFPCPVALSSDRQSAILPTGLRYDRAKNAVTTGVCTDNMMAQWSLLNVAVTASTLYANSNPDGPEIQNPTTGAFTGTTTLNPTPQPKNQAPTLVLPDGSGLFTTTTDWIVLPASH